MKRNIVITGGAGFIGSHVVRLFVNKYPEYNIINLDKLTYAGNLANLYAGLCYAQTGKWTEAAQYLEKYSPADDQMVKTAKDIGISFGD